MEPYIVGLFSLIGIVVLIYAGCYVGIALSFVSFLGVWFIRDPAVAVAMMQIAVHDAIKHVDYASIPTFVMMGLIVGKSGFGTDIYDVANQIFRRLRGGLGIATVAANAAFAAVTGSSIAAASVFTRVSVPEMIRYQYTKHFAVGVVAGSSVLGMIIPPSVMMIIYAFVAEQSVAEMFIAGIVPGLLLAAAFIALIMLMTAFFPRFIGQGAFAKIVDEDALMSFPVMIWKLTPLVLLILIVLGGIYTGFFTPSEAGATGALTAFILSLLGRRIDWRSFKEILIDTGHITANLLFLIIAASMYSKMLGIAGLPWLLSQWIENVQLGFLGMMTLYVILLLFLGTIIDTGSIILVCVPLFLSAIENMNLSLVWFGLITVVGAEIGLLTPPFGLSCFVIKTAINRDDISLNDIFWGAAPFAFTMLLVLIVLIAFPQLSLVLL